MAKKEKYGVEKDKWTIKMKMEMMQKIKRKKKRSRCIRRKKRRILVRKRRRKGKNLDQQVIRISDGLWRSITELLTKSTYSPLTYRIDCLQVEEEAVQRYSYLRCSRSYVLRESVEMTETCKEEENIICWNSAFSTK